MASARLDANISTLMPAAESFSRSGSTSISLSATPLTSTIATSSSCSRRLAITLETKSLSSRNPSPCKASPRPVTFMKKAGISVALALNTFGREMSGSDDMLLSIFSFTSMKAKSMSCPCSNESTIDAEPSRDSVCSPARWSVCTRFCRSVLTTTSSSSRADMSGASTCTVT